MGTPRDDLARRLREARVAAGYSTQAALARALPASRPAISKAENPLQPIPSEGLITAWCGITGAPLDEFLELAERARSGTPDWFMPYQVKEAGADTLRCWSPMIFPGLLQTSAYAHELFVAAGDDANAAEAKVAARMKRQAILARPHPPHLVVVLGEYVLRWQIGSPAVMADQLNHVASMAQRTHISVHILPATGANAGLSGAFDLASTDGTDPLRMDGVDDVVTVNRPLVRRANIVFDLVRRDALPRIPSHAMTLEACEQWKAQT